MKRKLLIVDDEESIREMLSVLFASEDFEIEQAESVSAARAQVAGQEFDIVLCDILMPDGNGLELLREIKAEEPSPAVIMMTAYTSTKSAVEAMKLGAFQYVSKPFDVDELKVVVGRALEKTKLEEENLYLRRELEGRYTFANIIGSGPRMQGIFDVIRRVARTNSTVLVQGESGTGKELIARALHYESERRQHRFLTLNCGALPENLLESELFGHERGAFTGAIKEKKGLFQEADKGTLFLDEIGEMSPVMQVKLLRALQERTVRRVGGTREEPFDVRIIAATNRDLQQMVADNEFREDLFYRINVIPIDLPPLRERREDIPLLVEHFLGEYSSEMGIETPQVSREFMSSLESYDWPGNVRELENVVERVLALASSENLTTRDLPPHLASHQRQLPDVVSLPEDGLDLEAYLNDIRARLMAEALERCNGVQTQAADLLGMTFRSFRYYAKKVGITSVSGDGEGDEGTDEDSETAA